MSLPPDPALSSGKGMTSLVMAKDWSGTPLGPRPAWPAPLVNAVNLMLGSRFPMFVLWGAGHIMLYNDAYIPILGRHHPEALGRRFFDIWPEVRQEIGPIINRAMQGESSYFENMPVVLHRDGYAETTWFTFSYSPLYGPDGAVGGAHCTCIETTSQILVEQRQALQLKLADCLRGLFQPEDIAREAATLLGQHFGARSVALGGVDRDSGTIRFHSLYADAPAPTSQIALDALGAGAATALRQGLNVVFSEPAAAAGASFADARSGLAVPVLRHEQLVAVLVVGHDEPRRWQRQDILMVQDAAERAWQAIERANAEHTLRVLNETLEHRVAVRTRERDRLWRMTHDTLAIASLSGYFLSVNPAFTAALGWTEAEAVARPFIEFTHPDDRADLMSKLAVLALGQPLVRYEIRDLHKDGSYRWMSWTIVPEGDLLYGVARDITEEKRQAQALRQAEDALRQAQKMEAVGQLTGGIAHDFNNLLGGMMGHLELTRLRLEQSRAADALRHVDGALGLVERAASLTHRLLAFSRRQTLSPKTTDVNRLVDSMHDLICRTVGPAVEVRMQTGAPVWPVFCDPHQLENALLNLAINARDAMPNGGVLSMRTGNLAETPEQTGDQVEITVTDTGAGMSAEVLERAFDPFFTTKPMGQGTGLGLSMVHGFVHQSGGQVRIDSAPGQGTTVRLVLPRGAGEPDADDTGDPPAAMPRAAASCILVVDDEASIRELMSQFLQDLGYRVIAARDGAEAMLLLQSAGRIDLMVTDVGLPGGLNGIQLAGMARAILPALRVLFITGYVEGATPGAGFGPLPAGAEVLVKPFGLSLLADRLRAMLDPAAGA